MGIEDAGALGEDRSSCLIDRREIGVFGSKPEEAAPDCGESSRDHHSRHGITGEQAAEGQFFDWVGVVQVEPGLGLAIYRAAADAQPIFGNLAALTEDAVCQ